jgi:DNA-binding response OmpR family regulator
VNELERAEIPVRAFGAAQTALAAIAEDKPDVIILELAVSGELGGKDLVNMIKATMEWVDIPIVLWTRETVSNQKEARQIHGADEVVSKSMGAAALVARVITVFRR